MEALRAQSGTGQDRRIIVQFFMDAVEDEAASAKEGRPKFRDQEFIKKMIPGDATCNVVRPVTKSDTIEFAREYMAFKAGQEAPIEGTPLTVVPFLTKAQCLEMAAVGIKTCEQLRDISDVNGQKFMGFQGLRRKVIAYLESAEKNAGAQKLQAELEKRDEAIAGLQRQIEEMVKAASRAEKGK